MHIGQGPENLFELFNGEVEVSVPSFQRNYVWKKENVKQFLNDLFAAAISNDSHFFGPIVIFDATKPGGAKKLEIIDGQQRITTSVMVLAILRDMLSDTKYFATPPTQLITAFNARLYGGLLGDEPKFLASYLIRDFFKGAVTAEINQKVFKVTPNGAGLSSPEKAATKSLRGDYLFIQKYLREKFDGLAELNLKDLFGKLLKGLTQNFQIHSMVVDNEVDAYRLFESVNYLGLKLEPGDLLKSLTLRKIQEQNPSDLDQALADWDKFIVNLDGYPVSKFLRHYLLTVDEGSVKSSKIFGIFKQRVDQPGMSARKNLDELLAASRNYGVLLGAPGIPAPSVNIARTSKRLNIIGDTQRVLLLSILQSGLTFPQKEQAFRAAEYLVFRYVCARENAQSVEDSYQALGHELRRVNNQDALNSWCDKVVAKAMSDADLRNFTVKNCSYAGIQHDPREDLARYALSCIEGDIGAGWPETPTLEHLAPQNPNDVTEWTGHVGSATDPYDVQLHWWGNLTLLESSLNSSISNGEWSRKLSGDPAKTWDGLKKSGFYVTKHVCKVPVWNSHEIKSRGDWMLETLLKLRGSAWVKTGSNNAGAIPVWPANKP